MSRPSKQDMYMSMAKVAAQRSTCIRFSVGAIITDAEMANVIAVGYNGPPKRTRHGCHGDAKIPGGCGCLHAEVNALLKAPFTRDEQTLFVTLSPCINCASLLLNSRVTTVYYADAYRDTGGIQLLRENGMGITHLR